MKSTAQKLLLSLYTPTAEPLWIGYDVVQFLLPEISSAGQRSLIAQLKQKSLISVERWERTQLRATQQGYQAITVQFPALSRFQDWQGEWTAVMFLSAPSQDPNFRYLRSMLLQNQAVPITRGMYLYPGPLPAALLELCQDLYREQVAIVQWGKVIQGDLLSLIAPTYALSDIFQTYSGISTELNSLLRRKLPFLELNHSQKEAIYLVFDRFFTALLQDPGITQFYYPQSPRPLELLGGFQELLTAT